jgi:hypothetical protein
MIVWREQAAGGTGLIKARTYDTNAQAPLGTVLPVDPAQGSTEGRNPRVAALGGGRFVAIWEQQALASTAFDLRAATGTAAAWQPNVGPLESGAGDVDQSLLVAGPAGTAIAVWRQNDAVFFARYVSASGQWSVARQVGSTGASHTPRVAVAGNGNAIFVWLQKPGGSAPDDLFYATFTASNGTVSGAYQLDTEASGAAASPSLSVAADGGAVVAWLQHVGAQLHPNVVARVFRP